MKLTPRGQLVDEACAYRHYLETEVTRLDYKRLNEPWHKEELEAEIAALLIQHRELDTALKGIL